jgi:hypothetical protein
MTSHTPGPWKAGRKDMASFIEGNPGKWIYADGNDYIAAAVMDKEKPWDEVTANARLIAAAPEMLDALEWLANEFDCRGDEYGVLFTHSDFAKVRDVLQKVRAEHG